MLAHQHRRHCVGIDASLFKSAHDDPPGIFLIILLNLLPGQRIRHRNIPEKGIRVGGSQRLDIHPGLRKGNGPGGMGMGVPSTGRMRPLGRDSSSASVQLSANSCIF